MKAKKVGLFIPTLNGGETFKEVLEGVSKQILDFPIRKLIIDSGSQDKTILLAENNGFEIVKIQKKDFNHGGTRNLAVEILKDCEIVVMMTQDVIMADNESIKNLISIFEKDENIVLAYGRQVADPSKSNWFENRTRRFNYPDRSQLKDLKSKNELGIKTVFASNAFSAYNVKNFKKVGGFPKNINFSEDMYIAAKSIRAGYKIAYQHNAIVFHTHNYTLKEEYKRYLEIGKFHASHPWIQKEFGSNENEGIKLVVDELKTIISEKKIKLILYSLILNSVKYIGYRQGRSNSDKKQ